MNGLVAVSEENISSIRTALHELEEQNYLQRIRHQKENGKFEYEYIIYEEPPYIDFLHTVNPYTENHTQINTNITNTNNKDKYDKQESPLIKGLINRKFIDKNDLDIPKYYDLLNELLEEYDYYDVVKVCGYIADKWQENKGLDENSIPILNKYGYFKSALLHNLLICLDTLEKEKFELEYLDDVKQMLDKAKLVKNMDKYFISIEKASKELSDDDYCKGCIEEIFNGAVKKIPDFSNLDTKKIDVSNMTLEEVTNQIIEIAGLNKREKCNSIYRKHDIMIYRMEEQNGNYNKR